MASERAVRIGLLLAAGWATALLAAACSGDDAGDVATDAGGSIDASIDPGVDSGKQGDAARVDATVRDSASADADANADANTDADAGEDAGARDAGADADASCNGTTCDGGQICGFNNTSCCTVPTPTAACAADCALNPGSAARQIIEACSGNTIDCLACPAGGG